MLKLKLQDFGHLMWRTDSFEFPWCWERLKAGGEGDDRGWDGQMASLTQWKWVWVNSGGWWWTGRPGVLQSMGSQRIGHDWETELNWFLKILFRKSKDKPQSGREVFAKLISDKGFGLKNRQRPLEQSHKKWVKIWTDTQPKKDIRIVKNKTMLNIIHH